MIATFNKIVPELNGCKSFQFEVKQDDRGYTHFADRFGLEAQRVAYEHIRAILKQFIDEPCEVQMCVGVQQGKTFLHGAVWLYDHKPECYRKSSLIFQGADWEICKFRDAYGDSEFMLYYHQSVTILRIVPH